MGGTTKIQVITKYTRELVTNNPNNLYVFGDNTWRRGTGGQAIIRGLPNTFGICTKLKPSQEPSSYFDDSVEAHAKYMIDDINDLVKIMKSDRYESIVFPSGGLGTGLSDMPNKCPKLFEILNRALIAKFDFDNKNGTLVKQSI